MRKFLIIMFVMVSAGCSNAERAAGLSEREVGICNELALTLEDFEKGLAEYDIRGENLDASEREDFRHRQLIAAVSARSTIDLMVARSCPLPERAPNPMTYWSAAFDCAVLRAENDAGNDPTKPEDACSRDSWEAQSVRVFIPGAEERLSEMSGEVQAE